MPDVVIRTSFATVILMNRRVLYLWNVYFSEGQFKNVPVPYIGAAFCRKESPSLGTPNSWWYKFLRAFNKQRNKEMKTLPYFRLRIDSSFDQ